jgi:Flp pilus assembly protein TadG
MNMRNIFRNDDGTGAVEFAFIGPVLAMVLIGLFSSWSYFRQESKMGDVVGAVAKYYIMGGTKENVAQSIGNAAWTNKPSSGALSVVRQHKCNGTNVASTVFVCGDNSQAKVYLTIQATSTWTNPTYSEILDALPASVALSRVEVVRVR